jgi:hypothetical protein
MTDESSKHERDRRAYDEHVAGQAAVAVADATVKDDPTPGETTDEALARVEKGWTCGHSEEPLLAPADAKGELLFGGPDPADTTEEAARTHGRNDPARDQRSLRARADEIDTSSRYQHMQEKLIDICADLFDVIRRAHSVADELRRLYSSLDHEGASGETPVAAPDDLPSPKGEIGDGTEPEADAIAAADEKPKDL